MYQGKCKHEHKYKCERKGDVHISMNVYLGVQVKEGACQGGMRVLSLSGHC